MCPFLNQLIGTLESDELVGSACAIGFLLKLEEWANLKTGAASRGTPGPLTEGAKDTEQAFPWASCLTLGGPSAFEKVKSVSS